MVQRRLRVPLCAAGLQYWYGQTHRVQVSGTLVALYSQQMCMDNIPTYLKRAGETT